MNELGGIGTDYGQCCAGPLEVMDLLMDDDRDEQSQCSSNEEALVGRRTIFVDPSCASESPSPQPYVLDKEFTHPGYSQGTETTAATPRAWDLSETFQSKNTAGGHRKQPISIYEGNPVNDQRNNTLFVRLMTLSPDNKSTTVGHYEKLGVGLTSNKCMRQFLVRNTSANCGQNCYINGLTNSSAQVSENGISPREVHPASSDLDVNGGFIDCSYSNSNDDLKKLKFNGISSTIFDIEPAKKVKCPLLKDSVVKCESNSSLAHKNAPIEKVMIVATNTNSEALKGSNHQSRNEPTVSCSLSRFYRDASGQKSESGRLNMKHANSPYPVDEPCERNSHIETLCFAGRSASTNSESVDEFTGTEDAVNSLNSSDRIRHEILNQHSVDSNRQNIEPVVRCNLTSVLESKFCNAKEGNEAKPLNDKSPNPISKETVVNCAKLRQFGQRLSNRNSVDIVVKSTCSKKPTKRVENAKMDSGVRCLLPPEFVNAPTSENDKNEVVSMVTSPVRSDQTVRCIFPEDHGQIVMDPNDGETRNEDIGDCMENLTLPLSDDSTGRFESNKRISNEQNSILLPEFGRHLSNLEGESLASHFQSGISTLRSRENDNHKPNDEQTVKCRLPMAWFSDRNNSNYEYIEGLIGTAKEVDSGPQSYCETEWKSRRSEGLPKRSLNFSESTTTLRFEESETVESLKPDAKCMLPFTQQDEDDIHPHIDNCETVLYGVQLRETHATFVKSVPNFDDSEAQGIIDQVLGDSCKEFVLENCCSDSECMLTHNVKLNLELPERDAVMVHKIFTKWFLDHSKQPNFKVLLVLMSSLTLDYGSDLLFSILCISQAFFKLKQNYRRPFGIKLIERMIHLVDLQMKDAIRTILTFTITRETDKANIEDLLKGLGIFEPGMACILESISCIWHITDAYEFPLNILFSILEECLQMEDISVEFKRTKDKIAAELTKLPRSVLRKQFHQVGKFLRRFYPVNSQVSFNLNSIAFYGAIPETEFDPDRKSSYKSCRVKSTGHVNWDWDYWDLSEARLKACHLMMGRKSLENQDEEVPTPPRTTPFQNLNMDNLIDDDETISSAFLPKLNNCGTHERALDESTTIPIDDMNRIEQALNKGQFRDVSRVILSYNHPAKRKSLDKCLSFLMTLLARYPKEKVPHAIFEILALLPRFAYDDGLSIRKSFVSSVNSLVLIFYERVDYKSALKLLKTLRVSGENALEYTPSGTIDPQTFVVVCSDIHLECRCFPESLRILLYGNCMDYIKYNIADQLCMAHFFQLESVILKMFKIFLKERLALYALNLFRAILLAQRSLNSPINIGIYYEVVLCHSFVTTCKASCDPHAGANLFITVDRMCGNEVRFRTATYRSLVVKLLQASAPEDIVLRTLLLCQKLNVYPRFTLHSISLGTHLVTEEMYLYIFYFFKYFLEGNDGPTLLLKPCSIKMTKMTKPLRKPFPVLEEIVKVSNELPEAFERLKASFKRIVGDLFDDLYIDFSSPSEAIIPSVGMETIMQVLVEDKRVI